MSNFSQGFYKETSMANRRRTIILAVLHALVVFMLVPNNSAAQGKIVLRDVVAPANLEISVKAQPETPQGNHRLPRVIVFGPSQFSSSKESFIAARLFELLGSPKDTVKVEFERSYYADYFADRMGVITREARAAAVAAVSPAAAAAFSGSREKANGIVYVLASGSVNGKPFDVRTEHLYEGVNDPATTRRSEYAPIAEAALLRTAQDIANAIERK